MTNKDEKANLRALANKLDKAALVCEDAASGQVGRRELYIELEDLRHDLITTLALLHPSNAVATQRIGTDSATEIDKEESVSATECAIFNSDCGDREAEG